MTVALISFDLDGTLVDTAAEIAESVNRALEEHGVARRRVDEITLLIGAGARELMLRLLARVYLEQPALADRVRTDAVLASLEQHYAALAGSQAQPFPGALQTLARLRAGGVRLACVTNKETRYALRVLQATRLEPYFDLLIGGDSLPEKKPHRSVLQHVAQVLGVDTRCAAHVGDSRHDVEAARNAGVVAWAVPYGYNGGQPIAAARPQRVFDQLDQIADHVLVGGMARAA